MSVGQAQSPEMPEPILDQGALLTKENVTQYATLLPQILKEVIDEDLLTVPISKTPLIISEMSSTPLALEISASGDLASPPPSQVPILYPFPTSKEVPSENGAALKMLWNTQSILWHYKIAKGLFTLTHKARDGNFSLKGFFARSYPFAFIPESDQLFRERISITEPASIAGYSWLTFRLFSSNEDFVWAISPLTQGPRQITGSNRTDPFSLSFATAEDFLGWSGRIDFTDASVTSLETVMVPLLVEDRNIEIQGNCRHATFPNNAWKNSEIKFPFEVTTSFSPRTIFRLELLSKDPYAQYGKQILLLDSTLFLPYYKVIFDRAGKVWKLVLTIFSLTTQESISPVPRGVVVLDLQRKGVSVIDYTQWDLCDNFDDSITLGDFDPYKLAEIVSPKPVEKAPQKKDIKNEKRK